MIRSVVFGPVFLSIALYAQDPRGGSHGYMNFGMATLLAPSGGGRQFLASATYVRPSYLGGTFSIYQLYTPSKSVPDDYFCRTVPIFGGGSEPCPTPTDDILLYSIRVVREFRIRTPLIRLGVEAGPHYAQVSEIVFFPNDGSWLGTNYGRTSEDHGVYGLSLRAKASFPLARYWGLEIATFSHINGFRTALGVEFSMALGLVRDRLHPKRSAEQD